MSPLSRMGGCDAELELLGHRDLDLRVLARRPEHAHALDAALRPDDGELLLAGVLAGLRKVGVLGELMALAEQRLDVFLREVDVMRRDLDEKRLLLLRFEHARDVDRLSARNASRAIMRSSSVGTTSTATFESSVEMRHTSSKPRASRLRFASSAMPMHSSPCSASARTTALPWPMPPVKITASSPPIEAT